MRVLSEHSLPQRKGLPDQCHLGMATLKQESPQQRQKSLWASPVVCKQSKKSSLPNSHLPALLATMLGFMIQYKEVLIADSLGTRNSTWQLSCVPGCGTCPLSSLHCLFALPDPPTAHLVCHQWSLACPPPSSSSSTLLLPSA